MKFPKWLIVVALGLGVLVWWYQGGNVPDWVPDWLRTSKPVKESHAVEYSLIGGFPAAADMKMLKKYAALSQRGNIQAIQDLKDQGLIWETNDGQKVRLLSRKTGSKAIEVQDIGDFNSYWTFADALEK